MKAALLVLFFIAIISVASAQNVTITLSDLQIQKGIKILVYDYKGQFIGEFNTTDTITLNLTNASSYVFVIKPSEQSWFSNPWNSVELFKAWFPTYLSYLPYFLVVVGSIVVIFRALR